MALGIYQINVKSWETFVISIIKSGLLSNLGITPQLKIKLTDSEIIVLLLIMQWIISY